MFNPNKKNNFNREVNELFLDNKKSDYGPVRSDVIELLSKYDDCLQKREKIEVKERLLFAVQYLMYCRHCARPVDYVLVENLLRLVYL